MTFSTSETGLKPAASLSDQIASRVRQEILVGKLVPGTQISQQWLCDAFGTSRMPARDALVKLAGEGVVEMTETGRLLVAQLSEEDVRDSFLLAAITHGRATYRATCEATDEELAILNALNRELGLAITERHLTVAAALNWQFHREINRLARSTKLLAIMRAASIYMPRDYLAEVAEADLGNDDHSYLMRLMSDRRPEAAETHARQHVEEAGRIYLRYLRNRGLAKSAS